MTDARPRYRYDRSTGSLYEYHYAQAIGTAGSYVHVVQWPDRPSETTAIERYETGAEEATR